MIYITSKQNSDAKGMMYQWGHKDPFTFTISSECFGSGSWDYGKYSVKIYTIDGVLIYQDDLGGDNKDKQPVGGIIYSSIVATSMMETIKKPTIFYSQSLINQVGHTRSLWDYYWISCSRGTDGYNANVKSHNIYLDSYTSKRSKSIYDPCPHGFRVPSNGTYNGFTNYSKWILYSYVGGMKWTVNNQNTWLSASGFRRSLYSQFGNVGSVCYYRSSTLYNNVIGYLSDVNNTGESKVNQMLDNVAFSMSVRCIEKLCEFRLKVSGEIYCWKLYVMKTYSSIVFFLLKRLYLYAFCVLICYN